MSKIYRPVIPIWIEEEDMRLIDADALEKYFDRELDELKKMDIPEGEEEYWDGFYDGICNGMVMILEEHHFSPTIDAVEVVRCRECKYASPNGKIGCQLMPFSCHDKKRSLYANGFCSYGEREGE